MGLELHFPCSDPNSFTDSTANLAVSQRTVPFQSMLKCDLKNYMTSFYQTNKQKVELPELDR